MKRRTVNVFGLSFLDVMFCGFGSVILLVMIVNSTDIMRREAIHEDLRGEVARLEREVLEGERYLVELRNTMEQVEQEQVTVSGRAREVKREIVVTREALSTLDQETLARKEHINRLKADIKSLEEDSKRLPSGIPNRDDAGDRVRRFTGQGDRQYLTGLKMGGRRVLVLVDASASMLDETIVNIVRRRNLPEERRRRAPKWQRTVATVEWLVSQLPATSKFQIYTFNTKARPAVEGTLRRWMDVGDGKQLDDAVEGVRATLPEGGTSLFHAFGVIKTLEPAPDNVFLITDGLPTQGASKAGRGTVSGEKRLEYFREALKNLPRNVPINSILLPIEGDPLAASEFWKLAARTEGSFLTPSSDWP